MKKAVETLIGVLREELQQYGELLEFLDLQQESVFQRDAENVLEIAARIDSQAQELLALRERLSSSRETLCRECGMVDDGELWELIPHLPDEYQPLVQALVRENNELLVRVRQRTRQNQMLLLQSVDLMRQLLKSLQFQQSPSTYNSSGQLYSKPTTPQATYENVG